MMFVCCSCKIEKERNLDNFGRNKNTEDGLSNQCRVCAKKYRDEHKHVIYPSQTKTSIKKYNSLNKDKINNRRRVNYSKNKEKHQQINKENYLKHKELRNSNSKIYYNNHKEDIQSKQKTYRQNNINYFLLRNRKRKAQIKNFANISQSEINNLLIERDHKCFYCKILVKRGINLHIDHKVPLTRGGSHNIDNLVPSCRDCNLRKGKKTVEEFKGL